jgi:nicotinamide-nucleotide amidase
MKAEIVSVGTELLLGILVDTNAPFLADQLAQLGIDNYWIAQVGDNQGRLTDHLRRAWERSDLIIISGGLGPTEDDVTRESLAALLGEEMRVIPELEAQLREFFGSRRLAMPESNVKQATLIPSAVAIPNPVGTAPGWWIERDGRRVAAMPGVPREMLRMWEHEVKPRLRALSGGQTLFTRTLKVLGLGESAAEAAIKHLLAGTNPTIATYAKRDGTHVRISAKAEGEERARALVEELEVRAREALGANVYGVDDETFEAALGRRFAERGLTLASIETVTGGLLAAALAGTASGAETPFLGGLVVEPRRQGGPAGGPLSDLDMEVIRTHGIASDEAARALAAAARVFYGADVTVCITGETARTTPGERPGGTIHLALNDQGQIESHRHVHQATPEQVKDRAIMSALTLLWRRLSGDAS